MKQKKDGWCGAACIQYALAKHGKEMTQEEIVKDTGTTVENGVDPTRVISAIKKYGFEPTVFSGKEPLQTLQKLNTSGKQVIVDYLDGDSINKSGHYSIFNGMSGGKVNLWNPSGGKEEQINLNDFISHWKDKTINGKVFKYWAVMF